MTSVIASKLGAVGAVGELGDQLGCDVGIADAVDLADGFLSVIRPSGLCSGACGAQA